MHSEFIQHLLNDHLSDISVLSAKKMFGGYGIYQHKKIFGIVSYDELYLKAKDALAIEYRTAGAEPFTYQKNGKILSLCYFKVPEHIFNNRELLTVWAQKSISFIV
jgi:DNA transformation protein